MNVLLRQYQQRHHHHYRQWSITAGSRTPVWPTCRLGARYKLINVSLQSNEVRWNDVATQLNNVHEFQQMVEKYACPPST